MILTKTRITIFLVIAVFCIAAFNNDTNPPTPLPDTPQAAPEATSTPNTSTSSPAEAVPTTDALPSETATTTTVVVTRVIDGDTIDVLQNGETHRIRLIGINTPETVDPRKPVECFGTEASTYLKNLLTNRTVLLETDESQGDTDKYNRLLRYVFLPDGTNVNLTMIKEGYAYEYTYNTPYQYQTEFKAAEADARENGQGLWGATCTDTTTTTATEPTTVAITSTNEPIEEPTAACTIKGNINSEGEKIYHVIGCQSYNKTIINEDAGERWFCSEAEALAAGWRKALNCN